MLCGKVVENDGTPHYTSVQFEDDLKDEVKAELIKRATKYLPNALSNCIAKQQKRILFIFQFIRHIFKKTEPTSVTPAKTDYFVGKELVKIRAFGSHWHRQTSEKRM